MLEGRFSSSLSLLWTLIPGLWRFSPLRYGHVAGESSSGAPASVFEAPHVLWELRVGSDWATWSVMF